MRKLRSEIIKRQSENFARDGKSKDVALVKAEIWQDRGEALREKVHGIVERALGGVTDEVASKMIVEAKDLKAILETGRIVTGQQREDDEAKGGSNAPSLAINIGLLTTAGQPQDAPIEV
jgi:hypothetical protein